MSDVTHITTCCRFGSVYSAHDLTLMGWTRGDGHDTTNYRLEDFFDADGRYLGPCDHGIEPLVRIAGYVRHPYRVAMMNADGTWDVVEHFDALDDADANRHAAERYPEDEWFVLDTNNRNINGGRDQ